MGERSADWGLVSSAKQPRTTMIGGCAVWHAAREVIVSKGTWGQFSDDPDSIFVDEPMPKLGVWLLAMAESANRRCARAETLATVAP